MNDPNQETARCFVPEMLVDFISRNVAKGKEGLEPSSFFLHGVCLLVDISGFTKLSGDFCKMGKAGIDELQLATNGYMGRLVETIYTFGGEIIKFAGDAIICVFATNFITELSVDEVGRLRRSQSSFGDLLVGIGNSIPSGDSSPFMSAVSSTRARPGPVSYKPLNKADITPDVVLRAMHCAAELRDIQTEKLSVHVAMSCGEMCFGILGGVENRWECLISGPCIHELSDCLDDAPSKQAVISAGCAQVLLQQSIDTITEVPGEFVPFGSTKAATVLTTAGEYDFEIKQLPSGNHRIIRVQCSKEPEPSPEKARCVSPRGAYAASEVMAPACLSLIRQFVPVPIADEVETGQGLQFIAEIREVTTMFMKWDSYDSTGKHRDLLELQSSFYVAQEVLQSTGAYLRQFLVDDKGCVLIGCWGMPHLSYLDNASRALSAAARIRRKLNKLHMECSFGITTGDVYCGTVGSALRMEYAAIGSVVNMAARLMCKAHGGILIDDATHARLEPGLKELTKALEPIKVKGREEPLPVFCYLSTESVYVKEKVVQDHEISLVCREALLRFVSQMSAEIMEAERRPRRKKQNSVRNLITGKSVDPADIFKGQPSAAKLAAEFSVPMRGVLVKGKEGSGRTTVVKWLRKQAEDRKIPVHSVRINRKDNLTQYFLWKRLFYLIAPKGLALNGETQRVYVKALLAAIYPGSAHPMLSTAYAVMKLVLGITLSSDDTADQAKSSWLSRDTRQDKAVAPGKIQSVLYKVFGYLFNMKTALFVVESVEYTDEASLKLLVDLMKLNTNSAVVLTATDDAATSAEETERRSWFSRAPYRQNALKSSPWSKQFRVKLEGLKTMTTITLENYTPAEIDHLLCDALKVDSVPRDVSQLVQDFSGGSYFWVHEIMQFITDHGTEQFLSAVDHNDPPTEHTARSAGDSPHELSARPSLRRVPSTLLNSSRETTPKSVMFKRQSSSLVEGSPRTAPRIAARQMSRTPSLRAPGLNRTGEAPHHQQLDKLVLCRFGNLSSDAQRVMRTASIIGTTFSSAVLHSLLTQELRGQLVDCFQILVNQRWLFQDQDNEQVYHFSLPYVNKIIYELTPSSERTHIHLQIADYMATAYAKEKAQYAVISFHYQQCKSDKALMYAAMAMDTLLQATVIYDFGDCLDLLSGSVTCCKTTTDVDVLLKLVDRARVKIRGFDAVKRRNSPVTWVGRAFAAAVNFFTLSTSSAAVAPESSAAGSKYGEEDVEEEGRSTKSVLTSLAAAYGLRDSTGAKKGTAEEIAQEAENVDPEKQTKVQFLQQLHQLYDKLSERYVEFTDLNRSEPAVMPGWQQLLLAEED